MSYWKKGWYCPKCQRFVLKEEVVPINEYLSHDAKTGRLIKREILTAFHKDCLERLIRRKMKKYE